MFDEIDASRKNLKKFGRTMWLCLLVIGAILFFRRKEGYIISWSAAFAFLFFAQWAPYALKPLFKLWMALAFCLGWFNTRLILVIVYYLALTPTGLLARLFKKDFLNLKIERGPGSCWVRKEHPAAGRERYERIF